MGNIVDLQNRINNRSIEKNKPKLDTKGIKKLRLCKPGIEKEYNLTSSQKRYARNLRKRSCTEPYGSAVAISVLAGTISVGTVVSNHISRQQENNQNRNAYENIILDREAVLDDAKSTLANIIYPDGSIYHDSAYVSFPSRDESRNINSVQVSMSYQYTSNPEYRYISGNKENDGNSEIVNEFLEKFIKVAGTSEPSQKTLQELQELCDTISQMNLKLNGNNIVDLYEKDNDIERD